jgi:hypothetical protein
VPEPAPIFQHPRAYREVPYPPPAAFVELVPDPPSDRAVWVDGRWTWQGKRYYWKRGGWVAPPAGARYARWRLTYRKDGTILFAESGWYDAQGRKLSDVEVGKPATVPPNEITAEEQQSGQ